MTQPANDAAESDDRTAKTASFKQKLQATNTALSISAADNGAVSHFIHAIVVALTAHNDCKDHSRWLYF